MECGIHREFQARLDERCKTRAERLEMIERRVDTLTECYAKLAQRIYIATGAIMVVLPLIQIAVSVYLKGGK